MKSPHFPAPRPTKIHRKLIRREVRSSFERANGSEKQGKKAKQYKILRVFLTRLIQAFASQNLVGSNPVWLPKSDVTHFVRNDVAPDGRNDVMFAHCAEGTTSLPKATSLGEADITCT